MNNNIPEKFLPYLGNYCPQYYDSYCGEIIMWGYSIRKRLGQDLWEEISEFGELVCDHGYPAVWSLITKKLTYNEAVEKYGSVTDVELGPRGGFRSITFGGKKFADKNLYREYSSGIN